MTQHMIGFAKNRVTVNAVTEANSTKYKINFGSATLLSALPGYVMINDKSVVTNIVATGLNVCRITNGAVVGTQSYAVSTASGLSAFKTFIGSDKSDCLLLYTSTQFTSSNDFLEYLKTIGSTIFLSNDMINNTSIGFAYCAVISQNHGRICKESKLIGTSSERLEMEFVYDSAIDVASTGFTKPIVALQNPPTTSTYLLSDYDISPGHILNITGESSELIIKWLNGTTELSKVTLSGNINQFVTVPTNATKLVYNGTVTKLTITRVSRSPNATSDKLISVNGLKIDDIKDIDDYPIVLLANQSAINITEIPYYLPNCVYSYRGSDYVPTTSLDVFRPSQTDYVDRNGNTVKSESSELRVDYTGGSYNGILITDDQISFDLPAMTCTVYYKYKINNNISSVYVDISKQVPSFFPPNFTTGWIQEVTVFNRVLTATEKNRRG